MFGTVANGTCPETNIFAAHQSQKSAFRGFVKIFGWEWNKNQNNNKIKRSDTKLDSRKQDIAFYDRVTTILKESPTPTKMSKINSRQIQ